VEGQVGGVDAAYACHPSLLSIPADLEAVTKPLSLAVGDKDSLLDMKSVEQIKDALQKKGVPTEVKVYEDQVHGFALRSDWSSDKDKKAMDDAEKQGIEWFKKHLA
jgi:dienelactone hydrolase